MSKKQFTPGPWTEEPAHIKNNLLDKDDNYRRIVSGEGFYDSETKIHNGFTITGYISQEDARLIAKSPEMYSLLHSIASTFEMNEHYPEYKKQIKSLLNSITNG